MAVPRLLIRVRTIYPTTEIVRVRNLHSKSWDRCTHAQRVVGSRATRGVVDDGVRLFWPALRPFNGGVRESELVSEGLVVRDSGGAELAPFGERGRAALLEDRSVIEVAVLVEVVEHGRMDCREFLQSSHLPGRGLKPVPLTVLTS